MKKIIIFFIIFIFPCSLFSANFEFSFGGGTGTPMDFSDVEISYNYGNVQVEEGSRVDSSGFLANAFIDIGANFELQNAGALSSVSVLFETGYSYYMRIRTKNKNSSKYLHRFIYHNLMLGVLPKLNFNNGISLGIGAGIYIPLYSIANPYNRSEEISTFGLGEYPKKNKHYFKEISYMYKVPVMPYIKLSLEKNFYMSERWAFKIGADLLYNFGMEFDMENLKKDTQAYTFNKYKFSSLAFEVFLGFGFGRPR